MKRILIFLCVLTLSLTLTACMGDGAADDTTTSSPTAGASPTVTADDPVMTDMLPDAGLTDAPAVSAAPAASGAATAADARRAIEQIEDELERLSEVDDAQVVLAGNSAAVALEFDDQYHAGVDDRLRKIVKERIEGVLPGVTNVVVTADASMMDQLEALGDRLDGAADMTDVQNELNAIINKIKSALS